MNPELFKRISTKTDSRIFHLVIDGLGGLAYPSTGKTELEAADTPNLDTMAKEGTLGLSTPVAPGITPGSGPAHLSLFGYDPLENEVGRGILDISGVGVELHKGDIAARVNFCTVDSEGKITDRRAGRIPDEEGKRICKYLHEKISLPDCETHIIHTKEYRGGIIIRKPGANLKGKVKDTDPQVVGEYPLDAEAMSDDSKETATLLNDIIAQAKELLKNEPKANMLLVRGIDDYQPLQSFQELYQLTPLCIATYPMYRGVAKLCGMSLADIGSTASISDQFTKLEDIWSGKSDYDYIFFHIKKTDSAGEDGNFEKKVHVLEELDKEIPRLLNLKPDVIVVTGDHSTPSLMKSHSWHPLPTMIWGSNVRLDLCQSYGETEALKGGLGHFHATDIMPLAMAHAGKFKKYGA